MAKSVLIVDDNEHLRRILATFLQSRGYEISEAANLTFAVDEKPVPIREDVRAACEILGLDPLQVACEGRFVAFVREDSIERALTERAHRHRCEQRHQPHNPW